jgi:hypothetical protein
MVVPKLGEKNVWCHLGTLRIIHPRLRLHRFRVSRIKQAKIKHLLTQTVGNQFTVFFLKLNANDLAP